MRNKNTITQAVLLAALLPFLAFTVVLANHGADDEEVHATIKEDKPKLEERSEMRSEMKDTRKAAQAERKEAKEERKEGRRAIRANAIKTVMEMQIARSTKAYDRLSLILDKIENKSEELPEGADLTQTKALIVKAKVQQTALKTALDKAQDDFDALLATKVEQTTDEAPATTEPVVKAKQVVKTFMETMKDIKKKLVEFHKTLNETVKAMRTAAKAVETAEEGSEEETEQENTSETNN